ncbi:hypothetical protein H4R35_002612 [Dimargaris xerosporica]|nr:hypothetical protein H4R35_002612 [Dimargaris xerosporica]
MQPFGRKWALAVLASMLVLLALAQQALPAPNPENTTPQVLTDPATYDFRKSASLADFEMLWAGENIGVKDGLLEIKVDEKNGSPSIVYSKEIKAGKVDIMMKAAGGSGVATAFMMYETKGATRDAKNNAYPYDEIDIEIVGKTPNQVQSMFFSKGNRAPHQPVSKDTTLNVSTNEHFIHYGIELTEDYVKWYVNEKEAHSYPKSQGHFPRDAKFFRLGVWAAVNNTSWAGEVDMSKGPFIAQIQTITITPYPSGRPTGQATVPASTNKNNQTTTSGGNHDTTITATPVPMYEKLWNGFKSIVNTQVNKLSGSIKNLLPVQFTGL